MKSARIARGYRRFRVAHLPCFATVVVCSAGLMGTGCSSQRAMVVPDEVTEPAEPTPRPDPPSKSPVTLPRVQRQPDIVPDSTALFFGDTETRKTLVLRNQGNSAGDFSIRVPDATFMAAGERVTFTPASGKLAAGEVTEIAVEIKRDPDACAREIRLASLRIAQGAQNISVNYTNTGRADLQIDRTAIRRRDFELDTNVIDFGKEEDKKAEFTIMNHGCASGSLTILKSGLHENKLEVPGGPFTMESGQPQVIRLQRPDERWFFGTRSVTLLIRQDDATVDNVVVQWAGLSLLP